MFCDGSFFHITHAYFPETRRKEALAASNELTTALVDHLNVGLVHLVFLGQTYAVSQHNSIDVQKILAMPHIVLNSQVTEVISFTAPYMIYWSSIDFH